MYKIKMPRLAGLVWMQGALDALPAEVAKVAVDGLELDKWTPTTCVALVRDTIGPDRELAELRFENCPPAFVRRCEQAATAYGVRHKITVNNKAVE